MQNEQSRKYLPIAVVGIIVLAVLAVVAIIIMNPGGNGEEVAAPESTPAERVSVSGDAAAVAEARNLTPDDVTAALKTYVPTGEMDEYVLFGSGGHSGQVLVIGVPSMRLLKVIGVFTPEPWQGWGYGAQSTMDVLEEGQVNGRDVLWADTHHPALSETEGDYDGEFLFINDKANARIAVIDLRDFEAKQMLKNPIAINDHGGTMVTPNTEWIIEGGQYAAPLGWEYSSLENYAEDYRGMVTFWKFDRDSGRILEEESFLLQLLQHRDEHGRRGAG